MQGKRGQIAIIGSTGQLGQDLMRVFGDDGVGLSHEDVDVTNFARLSSVLESTRPDWVINTAAFHRVDECQAEPGLAFGVNAVGALNVAKAAAAVDAGVVHFSTDYVYSGRNRSRGNPYSEVDSVDPQNIYGLSKWAGEQLVAQANPKYLVIRSAGLYGHVTSRKGWTFPELMLQKARRRERIRVVSDQVLSPTFASDLADKTSELIRKSATGICHVVNSGECSWFDFARRILELARVQVAIEPVQTVPSSGNATRPSYSALTSNRMAEFGVQALRHWEDALAGYLQKKAY